MKEKLSNNILIKNKRATFDYELLDTFTAGIVLTGTEIKSIRLGKASLVDTFCIVEKGELWVKNMYIAEYFYGTGQCDNFDQTFSFSVRQSDGDLIRWDRSNTAVTLKKGHTYSISLAGSVCLKSSSRMVICTQVNDNFGDNLCADSTRVQTYVYDTDFSYRWQPFAFNRIFTATEDTPVKYHMTKIYPNTQLVRVNYNLTILALN